MTTPTEEEIRAMCRVNGGMLRATSSTNFIDQPVWECSLSMDGITMYSGYNRLTKEEAIRVAWERYVKDSGDKRTS